MTAFKHDYIDSDFKVCSLFCLCNVLFIVYNNTVLCNIIQLYSVHIIHMHAV